MKAITRSRYGKPEILEIRNIDQPAPKDNEILVKIQACTVNRTDCGILTGKPFLIRFFTGLPKPKSQVPGTDFAGVVESIGSSVKQFKIGDRVWGFNDEGLQSHAEYMCIAEDAAVTEIPQHFDFKQAVACGEGAHYALNFINKVKLEPGDRVLVNGATGAIGSAALQILKYFRAHVTVTGNTKNEQLLRDLGADEFINFEKEDFTEIKNEKYHFIFDSVGKSSFGKCKHLLLSRGIYISSELGPGAENLYLPITTRLRPGKRVIFPIPVNCRKSILFINELIQKDLFQAVIDREYKPEQIQEAYDYVASGQKTGNVIIIWER